MKKLFTIILIAITSSTFAQTYLMDNFNYSNDTLVGTTTTSGWGLIGTTTTNPILTSSTPLSYTGYVASSTGKSVNIGNTGQDIYKDINLTSGLSTGEVYVSFLANLSAAQATGDYFFALLPPANTSNFMARTYAVLSSPGYYKVAINRWTETRIFSSDSFALNQTKLFVIRYVFNTTTSNTDDSVYLYVFNSGVPSVMPSVPTAFCTNATSNMTGPIIGRVGIRQGSSSTAPTLKIGGLRFATNWADGPLPVNFTSFEGNAYKNTNHLTWATSSEINNKGFEVERSLDGENFETIGFVRGSGNSSRIISYQFMDENAQFPIAYYRLKQIDFDGQFNYSSTITIANEEIQIDITPNPFIETVNILSVNQDQFVSAEIIDITGKVKATMSGQGNLVLDTKDLNQGVYFIRVNQGEKIIVKRIIKN